MLMHEAAREQGWELDYGAIALVWRGGCIIRAQFLGKIKNAFDKNSKLENLLLDDYFKEIIEGHQQAWGNRVEPRLYDGRHFAVRHWARYGRRTPRRRNPPPVRNGLPGPFPATTAPSTC